MAVLPISPITASISLIIHCLTTWGRLYFYANNIKDAKSKLKEAERLYKVSQENKGLLHANILAWLGNIARHKNVLIDAENLYQNALEIFQYTNDILGQGNIYENLGIINYKLDKLEEAEALYPKALKFHKLANNNIGQGNDYYGLGDIYVELNKFQRVKASYQKALEFYNLTNDILGQ